MGPLGFALLRLVINGPYGQNLVWRNWWEEASEWLFIVGVGFVLWTFRRGLFPQGRFFPWPANGQIVTDSDNHHEI